VAVGQALVITAVTSRESSGGKFQGGVARAGASLIGDSRENGGMDKPQVVAFWMDGAPIADDDPLAAVKHRAHAIGQAAEVLDEVGRTGHVSAQADRLAGAAELLMDESFDLGDTWDAGLAAGLSELDLDAAGNVALILARIEREGRA
jgi:hypothetical protein